MQSFLSCYYCCIVVYMRLEGFDDYTRDAGTILSFTQLAFIKSDVLTLEFAHFFNFIEVYDKTFLISVTDLNAFSTEDCAMI